MGPGASEGGKGLRMKWRDRSATRPTVSTVIQRISMQLNRRLSRPMTAIPTGSPNSSACCVIAGNSNTHKPVIEITPKNCVGTAAVLTQKHSSKKKKQLEREAVDGNLIFLCSFFFFLPACLYFFQTRFLWYQSKTKKPNSKLL